MDGRWIGKLAKWRRTDEVSICIPTWQAAPFIRRTLGFALGQTHPSIRVLVSVDHCDDETAALCLEQAKRDPRLHVFVQTERLGWARNVNFLLDRVDTPYFCLYFHDDVLLPQYTARLLQALRARPDAASAHCDMGHFGATDHLSAGHGYAGSAAQRLGAFLLAPNRGSPLRSLTRSSVVHAGVRLPTDAVDGLWANEPYLMRLLAAGPALHLPEILYYRWNQRAGGLTDGWKALKPEELRSGFAANIRTALQIIDAATTSAAERRALRACLHLHMAPRLRNIARQFGGSAVDTPHGLPGIDMDADLAGELGEHAQNLACLGPEIAEWGAQRHTQLVRQARDELQPA